MPVPRGHGRDRGRAEGGHTRRGGPGEPLPFLSAEIQKERAERQAAREEVKYLAEDVKHLRSALVTVFLIWGLVVAVVGALLAGMMNQITRSLWAAFLVWWNS